MPTDALVIGGGLVGLSCALNLQLHGIRTTLVDPATTRRGASWGNAGHLATEQVEPLASPKTLRSFPRRLFLRGGALSLPARDLRCLAAVRLAPHPQQQLPLASQPAPPRCARCFETRFLLGGNSPEPRAPGT